MHFEVLVEDSSGGALLDILLPKLLGDHGVPHTWRVHHYRGIGRLPADLRPGTDATKRILLDQLPRLLRGYANTPGIGCVLVVVDTDNRDCAEFLRDLQATAAISAPRLRVLFRLAIEEMEAWYFGDQQALLGVYPGAKRKMLGKYVQDSVCGTWEMLADTIHDGGAALLGAGAYRAAGTAKHEWAAKIGPAMNPDRNVSPSFGKLRDGLRRLIAEERSS